MSNPNKNSIDGVDEGGDCEAQLYVEGHLDRTFRVGEGDDYRSVLHARGRTSNILCAGMNGGSGDKSGSATNHTSEYPSLDEGGKSDTEVQSKDDSGELQITIPGFADNVKRMGGLVEAGDLDGAMRVNEAICDTAENYKRLYLEGNHNFMRISETPDAIMSYILDQILKEDKFKEFRSTNNRFFELGSGLGNDAAQFVRHFPKTVGYHAVDAYLPGVETVRKRLKALQQSEDSLRFFGFDIECDDFLEWMQRRQHYQTKFPENERLIVHSKSTLHYSLEPIFRKVILPHLLQFVSNGNGLLSLSMKTPESPTWLDHEPIFQRNKEAHQDGYLCGIHRTEGQLRAFVTPDKLIRILDWVGFDVAAKDTAGKIARDSAGDIIISENASVKRIEVPDYDFNGKTEIFTTVLAGLKKCRK